jgi:hypothetical protein
VRPPKTRSPTDGGNRGQAGRNNQVDTNNSDLRRILQARRLQARLHCTETTATELARLVYGEASA